MAGFLHPSLRLLLRMQMRARWRKVKRTAKTPRGKLSILAMAAIVALWLFPMALLAFVSHGYPDPARIQPIIASGLFLFTLLTVVGNGPDAGVFFMPAEVELLFPAPLTRRDLLVYRLCSLAFGVGMSALFGSVFSARFLPHGWYAFCGIAMAMIFIQLVAIALGLAISIAGQAAYSRSRKLALGIAGALVVLGVVQVSLTSAGGTTMDMVRQFASTPMGLVLFLPFQLFARAITAERFFPDFAGWGAAAMALDMALITFVVRLDANFLESSAAASERIYRRLQRARAGQAWMNMAKPSAGRRRLPMLGHFRGAGPVAWRQMVAVVRGLRGMAYSLLGIAVVVAIQGTVVIATGGKGMTSGVGSGLLGMMTFFFLPQMLQFDFRGDLDRMDALKSLPASATAITVGQLLTPILVATAIELVFLLGVGFFQWTPLLLAAICAFLPVVNTVVFALENLVFLWYPRRVPAPGTMDLQAGARQLFTLLLRLAALGGVAAAAAIGGALAYFVFGGSTAVAVAIAWLIAAVAAGTLVPLVARAFRQFDPSRDTAE